MKGRFVTLSAFGLAALTLGIATFFTVREATSGGRAEADTAGNTPVVSSKSETPESRPAASPTPVPTSAEYPGLPEPSSFGADWDLPYREAYWGNPVVDEVVLSGIHVGPSIPTNDLENCPRGEGVLVERAAASGSPVDIVPGYLPPDAIEAGAPRVVEQLSGGVSCHGEIVSLEVTIGRKAAQDVLERLAAGESWFDIPTGGTITIYKSSIRGPNLIASLPARYWEAATINGLPGVVGNPILARGLGDVYVATWDQEHGILTVVSALNMTVGEATRILEGLQ